MARAGLSMPAASTAYRGAPSAPRSDEEPCAVWLADNSRQILRPGDGAIVHGSRRGRQAPRRRAGLGRSAINDPDENDRTVVARARRRRFAGLQERDLGRAVSILVTVDNSWGGVLEHPDVLAQAK